MQLQTSSKGRPGLNPGAVGQFQGARASSKARHFEGEFSGLFFLDTGNAPDEVPGFIPDLKGQTSRVDFNMNLPAGGWERFFTGFQHEGFAGGFEETANPRLECLRRQGARRVGGPHYPAFYNQNSMSILSERLAVVEERIESACRRAGRRREEITLLAVTKVFPAETICEAYTLGLREFGENYVQEFEGKAPALPDLPGARFHLIGHLQSNKSKKAAELFQVIETVDSDRLARRLNECEKELEVMIEVKLSEEQAKSGTAPEELPALIEAIRAYPRLRLSGLMTMPPWSDDPEPSRPYFRKLAALAQEHGLAGLSMGMSHDLEVAIEEGATTIRVGTALFGRRKKP